MFILQTLYSELKGSMKKVLLLAFLVSPILSTNAQNLVENPSFETFDTCPKLQAEVNYAVGWNIVDNTPDYFNACDTINPAFSVPYNWGGYQQAASGSAYSAFGAYSQNYASNTIRELIGGTLFSSLSIGTKYFVSFKVSLSISDDIGENCAINKLGAKFSTIKYHFQDYAPSLIDNTAQVYEDSIIKDSSSWTRIFGSFISDSNYNYIIIGDFFDNKHTDTLVLDTDVYNNCEAYYYLDDVCVSTDSIYALNYTYSDSSASVNEIQNNLNNTFKIFPNPAKGYCFIEKSNQLDLPYDISVYTMLGQEIYYKHGILDLQTKVDLSEFNSGLLFINIKTKNNQFNYKLLKL